ncbi:MAG: hypothetical protein CMP29_01175 [Roseibacillus sp.]|nr:hypothetical protein [Roseibacillus sp.]
MKLPGPAHWRTNHAAHNLALSSHPANLIEGGTECATNECADARDQHCKRAFFRGDEKADRTFVAIDLLVVSHVPLRAAGGTIPIRIAASTGFRAFFGVFFSSIEIASKPLF